MEQQTNTVIDQIVRSETEYEDEYFHWWFKLIVDEKNTTMWKLELTKKKLTGPCIGEMTTIIRYTDTLKNAIEVIRDLGAAQIAPAIVVKKCIMVLPDVAFW